MSPELKAAFVRLFRVGVAAALGAVWSSAQSEPLLLAAIPVIAAVGKYLRDRFGWNWLPF